MANTKTTEPLEALQRMFLSTAGTPEALRRNVSGFWNNQDAILSSLEELSEGWFERRHTGVEAALEAAHRMCDAKTPLDLMREYQTWAIGAFGRIMADGLACQQQLAIVGDLLTSSPPVADEQRPVKTKARDSAESLRPAA
jgi:hypothetical protein